MADNLSDDVKKRMDEGWKKDIKKDEPGQSHEMPEASFVQLIFSLSTQAFICLGEAPNPFSGETQTDLPQANFLIDTINVLKDKTKNNLANDESKFLDEVLHELMIRYVDKTKK